MSERSYSNTSNEQARLIRQYLREHPSIVGPTAKRLMLCAADGIEKLTLELARVHALSDHAEHAWEKAEIQRDQLREALETIAAQWSEIPGSTDKADCMAVIARQALRGGEPKAKHPAYCSHPGCNNLVAVHYIGSQQWCAVHMPVPGNKYAP